MVRVFTADAPITLLRRLLASHHRHYGHASAAPPMMWCVLIRLVDSFIFTSVQRLDQGQQAWNTCCVEVGQILISIVESIHSAHFTVFTEFVDLYYW